ncbi:MAG: family tricarboxylate transporter, receptor protein [Ramlibacter sp.]|jgi:tripartite-type tricarboxylate transporter receptor subunit TctC|nr:family tricarboxylate transporter, receptor protein [Ramlibacter sp.]MDB5914679.1 family tricarboxylate transporter, receptor protein [Ramlibacter sp.]
MSMVRRTLGATVLAVLLCVVGAAGAQTSGPTTKLIVGYPPGGNIDLVGRLLGQEAARRLHRTIIVESRVGAGGAVAAESVARAQPDLGTLLIASSANAILPAMSKNLRYDAVDDFEWVGTFTRYPLVLAVPRNSPYATFSDLLKAARANPGKITFASAGLGTTPHLVGEMVGNAAKVKFLHIPYKGEMPSMVDAIGGQVDFVVLTAPTVLARLRTGELRALAVTSETRWKLAPSAPTVAESGHPGFSIMSWVGLAAPKGTPAADVARLAEAFQQAQDVPEIRQQVEATGVEIYTLGSAQTRELMQREVRVWRERVAAAGLSGQ